MTLTREQENELIRRIDGWKKLASVWGYLSFRVRCEDRDPGVFDPLWDAREALEPEERRKDFFDMTEEELMRAERAAGQRDGWDYIWDECAEKWKVDQ